MQKSLLVFILFITLVYFIFFHANNQKTDSNTKERPNIVLIVIDTLRADMLGAYNPKIQSSSELDTLASGGTLFTKVYAQSSWTRPSMGSLLTSLHPRRGCPIFRWNLKAGIHLIKPKSFAGQVFHPEPI